MGWLFGTDWPHRRDIVRHLTGEPGSSGATACTDGVHVLKTLKKCGKGFTVLWALQQWVHKDTGEPKGDAFIVCYLIQYDRGMGAWGYKDVEESCGPCHKSCPVSWFDLAPCPTASYSAAWRESCRQWARDAADRRRARARRRAAYT